MVCLFMLAMPMMSNNVSTATPTNEEDVYAEYVVTFMELCNTRTTFSATLEATYLQMKEQIGLSETQCRDMAKGITDTIYDDLVVLAIPIYKKYYTLEDLKNLCDFMRTPTGIKFGKYNANISTEMMNAVGSLNEKIQSFVTSFLSKQ